MLRPKLILFLLLPIVCVLALGIAASGSGFLQVLLTVSLLVAPIIVIISLVHSAYGE